jgi:hypothetical protein
MVGRYRGKGTSHFSWFEQLRIILKNYEEDVLENQRLLAIDISLKATPTRWWSTHKEIIQDWY